MTDARFSATGNLVAMSGAEAGAAGACFACHGLDGEGDGAASPRLAGLDAGYMHKQLEDYAAGLRDDPVMSPIAKRLSATARQRVTRYYANLPIDGGDASAQPAPAVYSSCVECHGAAGEGVGVGGPVIAGQPAAYTAEQLRRWRKSERRNDPRGVMRVAASALSDAEIQVLAAWLETRSTSRPPSTDAASASAWESASEAPAASRAGHRPGR